MGMGGGFDPNAMAMMYQNMMKSQSPLLDHFLEPEQTDACQIWAGWVMPLRSTQIWRVI
jgi:hypothetical protein